MSKKTKNEFARLNLSYLCDRALAFEREKKLIEARQKLVEKEIRERAKELKNQRTVTPGGGWSVQLPCTDGSFVRVTKAGDTLKGSIPDHSEDLPKIRELCDGAFDYLFTTTTAYKLAENFRTVAATLVTDSEKLVNLVSNCGKTDVSYQVAKRAEGGAA